MMSKLVINLNKQFFLSYIVFVCLFACAPTKKNLFVLLPDPDGKVGTLEVTTKAGKKIITKSEHSIEVIDIDTAPGTAFKMEKKDISEVFSAALAAEPDLPSRFILYFFYDSTELKPESDNLLPYIITTIKSREPTFISITGHTDRVGSDIFNRNLSLNRANKLKDFFISKGIDPASIEVTYHGEANPLVKTEDEVPEPLNRRVEVIVR